MTYNSYSGYGYGGSGHGGYGGGYNKGGYDEGGYDRDGRALDAPEEPTDGEACGEAATVLLMTEDFRGLCSVDDSDNVESDSGWYAKKGAAYANGCNDGPWCSQSSTRPVSTASR
jgi:hypothetical protein